MTKAKSFRTYIAKRGENLDITWLGDERLQSGDDLPEPDVIAAAIMAKLQTWKDLSAGWYN